MGGSLRAGEAKFHKAEPKGKSRRSQTLSGRILAGLLVPEPKTSLKCSLGALVSGTNLRSLEQKITFRSLFSTVVTLYDLARQSSKLLEAAAKSGKEGMRVDGRRTNLNLGFLPTSWELSCGVGQRWRGGVASYCPARIGRATATTETPGNPFRLTASTLLAEHVPPAHSPRFFPSLLRWVVAGGR